MVMAGINFYLYELYGVDGHSLWYISTLSD